MGCIVLGLVRIIIRNSKFYEEKDHVDRGGCRADRLGRLGSTLRAFARFM